MLYADLGLHQLDYIARETLARKAMENFPAGLSALFQHIIADFYQSRPNEHKQILETLYAWLTYSKRPLTVKEANRIFSLTLKDDTFKVEDEVQGHSAR